MAPRTEKRLLQFCVLLGSLVPLAAGLWGIFSGYRWLIDEQWQRYFPLFMGEFAPGLTLDSHFHYLSGLLLGIGLGFISCVPAIEEKTERFRLLTLIVVLGGSARLLSLTEYGFYIFPIHYALIMELLVTPLLCLWQNRVAHHIAMQQKSA